MTKDEYVILAGVFVVEIQAGEYLPRLVPLFNNSRAGAQLSETPEIFHVIEVSEEWLRNNHLDVNGNSTPPQESNP